MRAHKIFLAGMAALVLLAVGVGLALKASFPTEEASVRNYVTKGDQMELELMHEDDSEYEALYFQNRYQDFSQLKEEAELIAKVKVIADRENRLRAVFAEVNVIQVYEGQGIKKGDRIYIYEPSSFYGHRYQVEAGYNIMVEGQEYVLFLKHLPIPPGYHYKEKEAITFLPTSTYFSKYPVHSQHITPVLREQDSGENKYTYDQIKDFEILTIYKEKLERYQSLKKQILQTFR
jgi:hypothetical protein